MHRQLYDSSFNKLYRLGIIEVSGLTMVYDDYPHIRFTKSQEENDLPRTKSSRWVV